MDNIISYESIFRNVMGMMEKRGYVVDNFTNEQIIKTFKNREFKYSVNKEDLITQIIFIFNIKIKPNGIRDYLNDILENTDPENIDSIVITHIQDQISITSNNLIDYIHNFDVDINNNVNILNLYESTDQLLNKINISSNSLIDYINNYNFELNIDNIVSNIVFSNINITSNEIINYINTCNNEYFNNWRSWFYRVTFG